MTWMAGRLLGFDTETSGVSVTTDVPVAFALVAVDNEKVVKVRHGLIDAGREIPVEATAVHGITTDDIRARGGSLEASLKGITDTINQSVTMGIPIVGSNCVFDLSLVNECYRRVFGYPWIGDGWAGRVIDVLVLDRHCDKFRKGSRKLTALAEHYSVKLENAHTARSDAEAAVRIAIAIGRIFPEVGNADPELLTLLSQKWHQEWFDNYADYLRKQGKDALDPADRDWPVRGLTKVAL